MLLKFLGFGTVTKSTHTAEYQRLVAIIMEARRSMGLSQQQVADRLGKPQSYVAKVEGAERRIDVIEFAAVARALGLDPAALFRAVLDGINETKLDRDFR